MANVNIKDLTTELSAEPALLSTVWLVVDDENGTDETKRVRADRIGTVFDINHLVKTATGKYIGGDQTGNARGVNTMDFQAGRALATAVASGARSAAFGYNCGASGNDSLAMGNGASSAGEFSTAVGFASTASGYYSAAFGYGATASGYYSTAFGYNATASGYYSGAVGYGATASGVASVAVGYGATASATTTSAIGVNCNASATRSAAFGYNAKSTVMNTMEIGYWTGSTRRGSIRTDYDGVVQFTIEDSATAPADGGATAGSEATGNLGRGMFTIHKNGTAVTLYFNNAGTIQSLSLGTLA